MFNYCNHKVKQVADEPELYQDTVTLICEDGRRIPITRKHYENTIVALTNELVDTAHRAYIDYLRS